MDEPRHCRPATAPEVDLHPKAEPHPYPYLEDVHGDTTPCTCCDSCTHSCAQDI